MTEYIFAAANAIILRDVGQWKSFYLIIRGGCLFCIGVGLLTHTDHIISRFTAEQLIEGLSRNQWNAIQNACYNYYKEHPICQNHPKQ